MMNRWIFFLVALLMGGHAQAQTRGDAAVATAKTVQSNHWQNWAFAGSALITAATAILIVSVHDGHSAQTH